MTKLLKTSVLLTTLTSALGLAQADAVNPLDPSAYQGRPTRVDKVPSAPYVDLNNPLVPVHGNVSEWIGTVRTVRETYRDAGNPLSPDYYVKQAKPSS